MSDPTFDNTRAMTSREIMEIPTDPVQMRRYLQQILRQHYQDIKTLFETTTTSDAYEQSQRHP